MIPLRLQRAEWYNLGSEVDGSQGAWSFMGGRLMLVRLSSRQPGAGRCWAILSPRYPYACSRDQRWLGRHGLDQALFPTRAAARAELAQALQREPLP